MLFTLHYAQLYVDKTTCALRTRMIEHTSAIRRQDETSSISRHFKSANHSLSDMMFLGIERILPHRRVEIETRSCCKGRLSGSLNLNLYYWGYEWRTRTSLFFVKIAVIIAALFLISSAVSVVFVRFMHSLQLYTYISFCYICEWLDFLGILFVIIEGYLR